MVLLHQKRPLKINHISTTRMIKMETNFRTKSYCVTCRVMQQQPFSTLWANPTIQKYRFLVSWHYLLVLKLCNRPDCCLSVRTTQKKNSTAVIMNVYNTHFVVLLKAIIRAIFSCADALVQIVVCILVIESCRGGLSVVHYTGFLSKHNYMINIQLYTMYICVVDDYIADKRKNYSLSNI